MGLQVMFPLALLVQLGSSWRHFMTAIPNAQFVPCPDVAQPWLNTSLPSASPGCLGGYCEALGHDGCSPEGEINDFGNLFDAGNGAKDAKDAWTVAMCEADSDFDGYTNGDELGDGCCTYNGHDQDLIMVPDRRYLTNPTSDISLPIKPSCTRAGSPSQPSNFVGSPVSASQVSLTWLPPADSCVCEYVLLVYTGGALTQAAHVRGDAATATLCGLSANSDYTVEIVAYNRAAGSSNDMGPPPQTTVHTVNTGAAVLLQCVAYEANTTLTLLRFVDTIPRGGYKPRPILPPKAGEAVALILVAPVVTLALVAIVFQKTCAKRGGCLFECCVVRIPCKDCLATCWLRMPWMRDFIQGANAFIFALLTSIVGVGLLWILSYSWYQTNMLYSPAQAAGLVWRSCGYALACCMGLQLIPVTRWSPWMHHAGVSFDRGVVFHRWISCLTLMLACVHGIGFALAYADSTLGLLHLFRWSNGDLPVNPLAGTLAGFMLFILGVLALGPVRRRFYELFLIGHSVYPAIIVLSILHTRVSETRVVVALAPGIALLVFDHVVLLLDVWLRPVTVTFLKLGMEKAGTSPSFFRVEGIKRGRWRWVNFIWPFTYHPGQFIYLVVPAVSLWPHPFSISSLPDASRPGWFSLHIRVGVAGSYTATVANLFHVLEQSSHAVSGNDETALMRAESRPPAPPASKWMTTGDRYSMYPVDIWVAGPFGVPSIPLHHYQDFVMFAGGIGITPIASLGADLSRKAENTVITAWAVREKILAEDILSDHRSMIAASVPRDAEQGHGAGAIAAAPNPPRSLLVFLRDQPPRLQNQHYGSLASLKDMTGELPSGLTFVQSRMEAETVLRTAIRQFIAQRGAANAPIDVAVITCGPQAMIDDVYRAVAQYPQTGHADVRVHVHKELFEF